MIVSISVNLVLLKFKFIIRNVLDLPEPKKIESNFFFYKSSKELNNERAVFSCENYEKGSF